MDRDPGKRDLGEYDYRVAHLTRFSADRRIASIKAADVTAYTSTGKPSRRRTPPFVASLGRLGKPMRVA